MFSFLSRNKLKGFLFAAFVLLITMAALMAGCDPNLDSGGAEGFGGLGGNTPNSLPSTLVGTWKASAGDYFEINRSGANYTLRYFNPGGTNAGVPYPAEEWAGTIRSVSNYNASAGLIIIQYTSGAPDVSKPYHAIYYLDLIPGTRVSLNNTWQNNGGGNYNADTVSLQQAIDKFTVDSIGNYIDLGRRPIYNKQASPSTPGGGDQGGSGVTEIPGMVWIPAGTFQMGSPVNELNHFVDETLHQVTLTKGFYMGIYPVTQAQYKAVMGTNLSGHQVGGKNAANLGGITDTADFPVEYVTWYDAIVFCNKLSVQEGLRPAYQLNNSTDPADWGDAPPAVYTKWDNITIVPGSNGYRLPTEAQWEYACRAGTTTGFNWGTSYINDGQANYKASVTQDNPCNPTAGTDLNRTSAVGSYAANAWGLYDMHGNVGEWCWDIWYYYDPDPQTDPTGADMAPYGLFRMYRGGAARGMEARYVRSAFRDFKPPYTYETLIGFRIVRP
jgi:formylglycine-generating enzyme required for sulfatase activity